MGVGVGVAFMQQPCLGTFVSQEVPVNGEGGLYGPYPEGHRMLDKSPAKSGFLISPH